MRDADRARRRHAHPSKRLSLHAGPTVLTVLYDADCRACTRIAARMAGADHAGSLRLMPLQLAPAAADPAIRALAAERDLRRSLHVIDADGQWVSGGEAMLCAWQRIPVLRPVARLARLPLLSAVVEPGYRWVARNRRHLAWLAGSAGAAKRVGGAQSSSSHGGIEARDGADGQRSHDAAHDRHRRDDGSPVLG